MKNNLAYGLQRPSLVGQRVSILMKSGARIEGTMRKLEAATDIVALQEGGSTEFLLLSEIAGYLVASTPEFDESEHEFDGR